MKGILIADPPPYNQHKLVTPFKLMLVSEEVVVLCSEVNVMTQIVMIRPSDVSCEITLRIGKPDFNLLAGAQVRPSSLPDAAPLLFNC